MKYSWLPDETSQYIHAAVFPDTDRIMPLEIIEIIGKGKQSFALIY